MTISSTTSKVTYSGNGSTSAFPFSFPIFEEDHLQIIRTFADGSINYITSNFSLTGVGDTAGGTVTYPVSGDPLPSGETLTLARILPLTQSTDLTNQGGFYPEVLETALDRQVMISQQLAEAVERSVKLPISSTVSVDDYQSQLDTLVAAATSAEASAAEAAVIAQESANAAQTAAITMPSISDPRTYLAPQSLSVGEDVSASGAVTFDFSEDQICQITLTETVNSITLIPPVQTGQATTICEVWITQGAGAFSLSGWPSSVRWAGGVPTIGTADGLKGIVTLKFDGHTYMATYLEYPVHV